MTKRITLRELLSAGKMNPSEALRFAVLLAETLQKQHDQGHVHGYLSPGNILLTDSGIELLPATGTGESAAYAAPEVLAGGVPDVVSDIYSFGMVLSEALAGATHFDRILHNCLSQDAKLRFQRIAKVLAELRLLTVARRCSRPRQAHSWEAATAALRAEFVEYLKSQHSAIQDLSEQLSATRKQAEQTARAVELLSDGGMKLAQDIALLRDQERAVHPEIETVDHKLAAQAASIESMRAEMRQTDDQIEWVVSILESLQSNMMREPGAMAAESDPHLEDKLGQQAAAIDSVRTEIRQTEGQLEWVVSILETMQSNVLDHAERLAPVA